MLGSQLREVLRDIKQAAETELGSNCLVSLFIDRELNEGLILEIKHKLGRYEGDGLVYHLRIDDADDLLGGIEKLESEVIAWIRQQRADYAALLTNAK